MGRAPDRLQQRGQVVVELLLVRGRAAAVRVEGPLHPAVEQRFVSLAVQPHRLTPRAG